MVWAPLLSGKHLHFCELPFFPSFSISLSATLLLFSGNCTINCVWSSCWSRSPLQPSPVPLQFLPTSNAFSLFPEQWGGYQLTCQVLARSRFQIFISYDFTPLCRIHVWACMGFNCWAWRGLRKGFQKYWISTAASFKAEKSSCPVRKRRDKGRAYWAMCVCKSKAKWPVLDISMQIHVYQVQGYSVLQPALGSPLEKVWGRGNIIKKEESEVQRKMLGDMELHIVRSNRKVEKGKRLLLFLWRAEILFRMVYFSEICTFCSCIQVWTRESSSFSSFLSTMYHSLCFLSYKISTSGYYTREPQKNLQSQAFWAWYGLWWVVFVIQPQNEAMCPTDDVSFQQKFLLCVHSMWQ